MAGEKKNVRFTNLSECPITGYLQRMDLLKTCGIDLPENFVRHDSKGRFVPVRIVDHRVEEMGAEVAECLAPGGGEYEHTMANLYDLAWYVFTETANNARQHSRGLGYATAQVTRQEGLVRIAIADNGKGILRSFQDAELAWSQEMSHTDAVLKALQPRISSKFAPHNEGVGLTLVSLLARLTGGWLMVVSGDGVVQIKKGEEPTSLQLEPGTHFQGTLA